MVNTRTFVGLISKTLPCQDQMQLSADHTRRCHDVLQILMRVKQTRLYNHTLFLSWYHPKLNVSRMTE